MTCNCPSIISSDQHQCSQAISGFLEITSKDIALQGHEDINAWCTNACLRRFLVARRLDVHKAEKQVKASIQWCESSFNFNVAHEADSSCLKYCSMSGKSSQRRSLCGVSKLLRLIKVKCLQAPDIQASSHHLGGHQRGSLHWQDICVKRKRQTRANYSHDAT